MKRLLARALSFAGPPGLLLGFALLALAWFSACRALFSLVYADDLREIASWRLFAIGLRMDSITVSYLLGIPAIALLALPGRVWRRRIVLAVLWVTAAVLVFMEVSTPSFINEFGVRPNRVFFEYLVHPREVFLTVFKDYGPVLAVALPLVALLTWGFGTAMSRSYRLVPEWSYGKRLLALPLVLVVLFGGARSTLSPRPANLTTGTVGPNRMANELALNSTYSVLYAVYNLRHETNAEEIYGRMPWDEVLHRVRRYMDAPAEAFTNDGIPTLHRQTPVRTRARPPNLVILIEESMGAQYVGSLGGLPLTPNLDRLSEQGLSFTRLYATGTRSSRGLEAIACGFPPTPAPAVIKLSLSQKDFFSLARLLKGFGYVTYFLTCGAANFENMGGFLQNNGFDHIIEEKDFENPVFRSSWGVSDEDLVTKGNEIFRSQGDTPFFGMMFTTSNHAPFEYPEGRIEHYEQPPNTRNNALKYADYAIGRLFELAAREPYYSNTIFMVVADHDTRLRGDELIPIQHFRIPAVIVGPGVPRLRYDRIASQIDLAPTLLGLMGLESHHPMIGRDLLALDEGDPGRSLMQYALTNAFRVGDRLVLHQPGNRGKTFRVVDDRLEPAPPDEELTRDALAHILWASVTYNRGLYREAPPSPTARLTDGAARQSVTAEEAP